MSCPLYEDYTRNCIKKFKEIVNITSFKICDSENYKECLFYIAIQTPEKNCKYSDNCIKTFFESLKEKSLIDVKYFIQTGKKYCLDIENRKKCARYKRYETDKKTITNLLPDGTIIESN